MFKSSQNKIKHKYLNVMLETAYAEYASALEMLTACKLSSKDTFANGYFEHSKDEYNHANTFLSILAKTGMNASCKLARQYRFKTNSLITKGYVSEEGYLIERMKLKDFIAYVYTNELLAKKSFEGILKLVKENTPEGVKICRIMDDELRHHGLAKAHFLKYYPRLQPWQLKLYRAKETIANHSRKIYHNNLLFLEKILMPLYKLLAYIAGVIILKIDLNQYQRYGKNLMGVNSRSVI